LADLEVLADLELLLSHALVLLPPFNLRLLVDLPDFGAYVGDGEIDGLQDGNADGNVED